MKKLAKRLIFIGAFASGMALVSPFFSVAQRIDDGGKDKKCVAKTGFDEAGKKECKGQGTACSSDSDCK